MNPINLNSISGSFCGTDKPGSVPGPTGEGITGGYFYIIDYEYIIVLHITFISFFEVLISLNML